ncbi:hypothetical protein ACHAWF_010348 [Thalassiosira exigua]
MSAGYAERLSEYPNKGVCGLPENHDTQRAFLSKLERLSQLIQQSKYTVVLTGAGISTSAGIPDFRGPSGIWTREQQERERKKRKSAKKSVEAGKDCPTYSIPRKKLKINNGNANDPNTASGNSRKQKQCESQNKQAKKFISFESAMPTYTHKALTHMVLHPPRGKGPAGDGTQRTYLHHIVTQNVDGLHRKTNLPRNKMSILHGCIFTEICDTCHTEHVREHEVQSIGLKHTGRSCTLGGTPAGSCPGKLKDTLLDWEDDLPELDWERAQEACQKADLVLCLGTSLRIEPAASLCTYPIEGRNEMKGKKNKVDGGGKVGCVIVNLQVTPYDEEAALVIRAKVDDVMKALMSKLGYEKGWDRREP